jgi:hypothetical protein
MSMSKEFLAQIQPAIDCPYSIKTDAIQQNLDGSVSTRTLLHIGKRDGKTPRLLVAVIYDAGDGGAPRFDFNPDEPERVAAWREWLAAAYPNETRGWAQECALNWLINDEADWDAMISAALPNA